MKSNWLCANNVLHNDNCNFLSNLIRQSAETEVAKFGDKQCSKSWNMYSHPSLDQLLEEFTPKMEELTGKKLFPTYSYARLYLNGEVLQCHTDREACEYSATINLGFGKDNWPIWIAEKGNDIDQGIIGEDDNIYRIKNAQQFTLDIGDALIYKGAEAPHWREEFKGDWQAQVFLHYVDQDGPHKDHKFDRKKSLSHRENESNKDVEFFYWYIPDAISGNSCDQMSEKFDSLQSEKAPVGLSEGSIDLPIRDVNRVVIPNEVGIGATLTGIGLNSNERAWKFDIRSSNQSEYLRYECDGHYVSHTDTFYSPHHQDVRKLTVLAFLNDDFEGGRFYIQVGQEKIYPEQDKGTVIVFPSFMVHGVEPVTKGTRRSIVTWLVGPWFK